MTDLFFDIQQGNIIRKINSDGFLHVNWAVIRDTQCYPDKFEPIKLDPIILGRFTKLIMENDDWCHFNIAQFDLWYAKSSNITNVHVNGQFLTELIYLHDFQNLYKIITKKEILFF